MKHLLSASGLSKRVGTSFVLRDFTFTVKAFEKIAIAGETGSGKSTLLKLIAGLVQPDEGELFLEGERILGPAEKLVPGHPAIAYLSQNFELPKFLRVEQVLSYNNALDQEAAHQLYELCHISHLVGRKTDELSGGEKQRVALARLLGGRPRLLLLDEPFAHLDQGNKSTLKRVIHDIGNELKITCTLVSHDPADTLPWADAIWVLKEGLLLQKGSPQEVYESPINEYAAGLLGQYNQAQATLRDELKKNFNWNGRIIRPEQLKLSREGIEALKGTVQSVSYFGHFREVVFFCCNQEVLVRTSDSSISVGQHLCLSLA